MQKLSPAERTPAAGSKATTPLTDSGHTDSSHTDSGHTEMAMQTPYHADQCVQQMLCRLTGTYEPHAPKVIIAHAPIAPDHAIKVRSSTAIKVRSSTKV